MKTNKEEKEILDSYENGEWGSVKELPSEKMKYSKFAKNTAIKNKRINIRLSEKDLAHIKARSLEEGIPYQTLITSIIHKYLNGKFKEM